MAASPKHLSVPISLIYRDVGSENERSKVQDGRTSRHDAMRCDATWKQLVSVIASDGKMSHR